MKDGEVCEFHFAPGAAPSIVDNNDYYSMIFKVNIDYDILPTPN